VPTPVLGFNNNVRHRGRIFHIQTEDSGVRFPRIVTHLFADGGRIIKTAKTDYTEQLERQDLAVVVRTMMKDQHKAMFISLRAGEYDVLLERVIGPLPEPPRDKSAEAAGPATPSLPPEPPPREGEAPGRRLSNPNLQRVTPSVAPPSPDALDRAVASLDDTGGARAERPSRPSAPPRGRKSNPPLARKRGSPQRPAAQFAAAPPPSARSIFGDGVGEKSLDEVILSYLAEDLDGGQE
jgi:hypothetical protein